MAYITWTEKYNIGIEQIDFQHKKLIALINEMHEAINNGKTKEIADKIVLELVNYTIIHFSFEEKLMTEYEFVSLLSHQKEHAGFKTEILNMQKQAQSGEIVVSMETVKYLSDWFIKHILVSDTLFGVFLKRKGLL